MIEPELGALLGSLDLPRFEGHSEKRESERGGVDDGERREAKEVLG